MFDGEMLVPIVVACVGGLFGLRGILMHSRQASSDQERHFLLMAYSGLLIITAGVIVLWLTIVPEYHWLIWMPGTVLVLCLVYWGHRRVVHIRATAKLAKS